MLVDPSITHKGAANKMIKRFSQLKQENIHQQDREKYPRKEHMLYMKNITHGTRIYCASSTPNDIFSPESQTHEAMHSHRASRASPIFQE